MSSAQYIDKMQGSRSGVIALGTERMEFPNPSPQLATVLAFLKAVSDQNPDEILSHLTDDSEYHWVTPGFDALGPQVKNKEQAREFFAAISGAFVKDFKVSFMGRIRSRRWS